MFWTNQFEEVTILATPLQCPLVQIPFVDSQRLDMLMDRYSGEGDSPVGSGVKAPLDLSPRVRVKTVTTNTIRTHPEREGIQGPDVISINTKPEAQQCWNSWLGGSPFLGRYNCSLVWNQPRPRAGPNSEAVRNRNPFSFSLSWVFEEHAVFVFRALVFFTHKRVFFFRERERKPTGQWKLI